MKRKKEKRKTDEQDNADARAELNEEIEKFGIALALQALRDYRELRP